MLEVILKSGVKDVGVVIIEFLISQKAEKDDGWWKRKELMPMDETSSRKQRSAFENTTR